MTNTSSTLDVPLAASEPLITISGISKRFPGVQALDDVSVDIRAGEVHCWIGENGAGKSTLIKVLAGIVAADSGTLTVEGRPVSIRTPNDALQLGMAFILQELTVVESLSVAENITLGHEARRGPFFNVPAARERAAKLMESIGFGHVDVKSRVGSLTIAEQQGVMIARALSLDARVIFMDEATAALDEAEVKRLFDVIHRLTTTGRSVVFVSHRLEEVLQLADQVTVFKDGRVAASVRNREISAKDLIRWMVGREIASAFPPKTRTPGDVVLEARRISTRSIQNVSLTARRGEIVGLGGLVGSGRSEVLRALYGLDAVQEGEILVDGRQVTLASIRRAMTSRIALVPEDRRSQGIIPKRSVEENTTISWTQRGRGRAWRRESKRIALRMIDELGVRTRGPQQSVATLSGGNQQKVLVGRCLALEPGILLLDEPTRGVDVGAKAEIYQLIDDLARRGMAVILVTSELPELLGLADRILVMREGRLVGELPGDAGEEEVIAVAMGHRESLDVA
jgi:ABC-type sugar transport system ATPase subunit